jgi:outer membrane protein assembly factor BamB
MCRKGDLPMLGKRLLHGVFVSVVISVFAVVFQPVSLLSANDANDWETYRGDYQRSGSTQSDLSFPLRAVWTSRAPAELRLAWSAAEGRVMEGKLIGHRVRFDDAFRTVVSDGRVYFGSSVDHHVHCVDLRSGETLWTFTTGGPVRLAPTVSGPYLLFGSDDGQVYCVDKASGALRWTRRPSTRNEWLLARGEMISKWAVRTGVLVHEGIAYYGAGIFPHEDVYLEGVDLETGEVRWRADHISSQDAGRDDLSPQGYLLAEGNLLFVPSGRSLPAAFDLTTGQMLHKRTHSWRTTAGGVVGGTRALLSDGQIYSGGPHHYLAMDQNSGDVGFAWIDGRQMSVQDDQAYVVTGTHLARLDRIPHAEASRERQKLTLDIYNANRARSGANAEKRAELDQQIEAANQRLAEIANQGVAWQVETKDDTSLLVTANHVVVGGEGRVTAYQKNDGQQIWQAEVDGSPRGLAAVDGYLLVSTDAGVITCFSSLPELASDTPTMFLQGGSQQQWESDPVIQQAAQELLEHTGVTQGFCLVLGTLQGDLPYELARNSQLRVYCIEPDEERVQQARQRLQDAGWYGHRITVHQGSFDEIPYSNYFANLVVAEETAREGRIPQELDLASRHVKPAGGVLCLALPGKTEPSDDPPVPEDPAGRRPGLAIADHSEYSRANGHAFLTRGMLPGAGNWSHQYGNPDNTAVSRDTRVTGDLGVLWYGDPGAEQMVNRHEGAVGPLAVNGRLFVQGEWSIMAYDAYNGVHLWTHENPQAIRTGVFQNQNPGNLAAGEEGLFHFLGDKCYQLDLATGELVATHSLPPDADAGRHEWGYVAVQGGILFGTATVRQELDARQRRRGRVTEEATDSIFAIDIESGRHLWSYEGKSISHHTIALAPDKVCFIDSSLTTEQRNAMLRQDKSQFEGLSDDERKIAEDRLKNADLRMAVALDARSGRRLWASPVDVTDCSDIGIGGGKLTMMFADGKLVLCGANANGHYWNQFMAGEFQRRRLVVLSADAGYQLWAKDANYLHRPIVIGDKILAEPWMYDLENGEQITRNHPVTGRPEPWSMMRTGHHCGMVTGSDSGMLLFRSGFTGFKDLNEDGGVRHFSGHRLGCWINAIVANGLVMIPEAGAGCVCQFSLESTIVLEPREARRPWSVFSAVGAVKPVKHLALNLGAPGDRKDASGQLWLSYPRYTPYRKTSLEVELDLKPQFRSTENVPALARVSTLASGGVKAIGFDNVSDESAREVESEIPWLYQSWASDLTSLQLPLTEGEDDAGLYTIRLHCADLRDEVGEVSSFEVVLGQGDELRTIPVELAGSSEGPVQPQVIEISGIQVAGDLALEFRAVRGTPILNAIEAIREE